MRFQDALNLRPTSRSLEIRLDPSLLDLYPDPSSEPEAELVPDRPLPLAEVLRNVDALHAECNGVHVCGLPPHLQRFDLYQYLKLARAAQAA